MTLIRENQRAQLAHDHVVEILGDTQSELSAVAKKYRSVVMKLPALVQSAGVSTALNFVRARAEKGQQKILDHLAEQLNTAKIGKVRDVDTLLAHSRSADLSTIQELTREVQRCLSWYKRMCQGLYPKESEGNDWNTHQDGGQS